MMWRILEIMKHLLCFLIACLKVMSFTAIRHNLVSLKKHLLNLIGWQRLHARLPNSR